MAKQLITLEGLEVLDAIDCKGSFAAAAASLYRVPSKVTYTVNKLEEDLGVTLFRREGRRAVLTPPGRLLLEQGRELLAAAERLVENTRQLERGWESRLRVAIDSVFELDLLTDLIGEFCSLQPGTEIQLWEEVLGGSWEAIAADRVDLVIGAPDEPIDRRAYSVEPFRAVPWVYAVAPTHPLAGHRGPLTREEQREHRAVIVRDSSRELPALNRRILETQQRIVVANLAQKVAAQRAGLGAGFLPRERIAHLLSSGELIEIDLEDAPEPAETFLVWKKDACGRALNWFIERLLLLAAGG